MKRFVRIHLVALSLALGGVIATAQTASIAGQASRADGTPSPGTRVIVVAIPTTNPPPATFNPVSRSVTTGSDGSFSITGLPTGTYEICGQAPRSAALLDPCMWSGNVVTAALTDGQAVSGKKITLPAGRLLSVHIADPQGLLLANARRPGAALIVAAGSAAFNLAPFATDATTSTGRDLSLVVPFNTPLEIVIHSDFYQLANASGPASGPLRIPVNIAQADPSTPITVQITGLKSH